MTNSHWVFARRGIGWKGESVLEFHENLQKLRRKRGLTQEELAERLYVSRTAVSKWESGRGYPSIDSLKAISCFFGMTIDDLLSGDQLLDLAEADQKEKTHQYRDLVFGLVDLCSLLLLVLPFFAWKTDDGIRSVSLLAMQGMAPYLRVACFGLVFGAAFIGILLLVLQNWDAEFWIKWKHRLSLLWSFVELLLFIAMLQPYAAVFLLVHFVIKSDLLIRKP